MRINDTRRPFSNKLDALNLNPKLHLGKRNGYVLMFNKVKTYALLFGFVFTEDTKLEEW